MSLKSHGRNRLPVTPGNSSVSYEQALEQLNRYMSLVQELRSHIDRSQFDLDALLDSLDYDEELIVPFVRDNIYLEQYPGLLRGTQSTLSSRAGNALDQSLLLAQLLKDAGLEARIARSTISKAEARILLSGLTAERLPVPEAGDTQAMKAAVRRFCQELSLDCSDAENLFSVTENQTSTPQLQQLLDRQQDTVDHLTGILEQGGLAPGEDAALDSVIEEARDYFWVEYRLSPGNSWKAAHPAFGAAKPEGFAPRWTTVYAEEVPQELLHKVRFEVFMQQRIGSSNVTHQVVPPWERPAANLDSLPITFTIMSKNFMASAIDPAASFDPDQIHTDLFLPVFSAGPAETAFDFAGTAIPVDAAASNFAGVFQNASNNFNSAAGALNGLRLEADDSATLSRAAELKSVIARYTSIAPDGEERQYQRTIYDARFPDLSPDGGSDPANLNKAIYRSLTRLFTFQVNTGSQAPAQVLDTQLQSLLQRQPSLEMILSYQYNGQDEAMQLAAGQAADEQISWTGLPLLAQAFDQLPSISDMQHTYRDRPNILVHHRTLPISKTLRESIDIVQNSRRAFTRENNALISNPDALIQTGVWETVTEGMLLQPGFGPSINTVDVFSNARNQDRNIHIIADTEEIDRLELPPLSAEAISRDIAMGYAVAVPSVNPADSTQPFAWWRIDPDTGETLGMGFNGEGAENVEYTTQQRIIAFSFFSIISFTGCVLLGGGVNGQLAPDNPARVTAGDCVAFGLAMGVGAASGGTVTAGMLPGFGFGAANYILGKLVDGWGILA